MGPEEPSEFVPIPHNQARPPASIPTKAKIATAKPPAETPAFAVAPLDAEVASAEDEGDPVVDVAIVEPPLALPVLLAVAPAGCTTAVLV
jgi:hypothetical protein